MNNSAAARVLLAFGGGDDGGTGRELAARLAGRLPAGWELELAAGWHPPAGLPAAVRVVSPDAFLDALAGCAILACSGGVTMWEGLCLGRPVVVLPLNAEQAANARQWTTTVAAVEPGDIDRAADGVAALVRQPGLRALMGRSGREAVDGRGLERLAEWCRS